MSGGPGRWWDRVLYVAVFVLATTLAVARSTETGIARDEVVYMDHGSRYATWWRTLLGDGDGLSERAITATFGGKGATDGNREHPPLMKTLFGLSEHVVHDRLGWADEVTAYRLPSALANALLVVLVMAWTRRLWGRAEAVVAAGCALFLPRALFHAELACFDAAIAALWFATVYAVWRGQASRRWAVLAGVMFGLALATKHNALILPAPLMLHAAVLAYRRQRSRVDAATAAAAGRPAPARLLVRAAASLAAIGRGAWQAKPWPLVAMAGLGPLVLIALWPWLWFDTVAHLSDWIGFHLHHVHYNFEYLGDNWNAPPFPWHVALVTTALTVPVVTLVAAGLGAAVWLARWRRGASPDPAHGAGLLLLLSAAAAMGPFFLGSTPIFGAEKHWAPAIPSLCVVAGVGAVWAARRAAAAMRASWAWAAAPMRARRLEHAVVAAVASLVVSAAATETRHAHPYGLTHYNALAGGAPGGADLGMNRQFWGYAARGVLPYLRSHAPGPGQPAAPVYSHDASPAWGRYLAAGLIPRSLPDAGSEYAGGIERSQWALVVHERHFARHDYLVWKAYGTVAPVFVLRVDGVPIVSLYRRPPRPGPVHGQESGPGPPAR